MKRTGLRRIKRGRELIQVGLLGTEEASRGGREFQRRGSLEK